MEAKLDALETRVVAALIITHSWAVRLAGAAYVGGSFGAGGISKGQCVHENSQRCHRVSAWGGWARVRLLDLRRLSLKCRRDRKPLPRGAL